MAGQWVEVPNLCARRWIEQVVTCAQWSDQGSAACSRWADEGSNQCTQWADEGSGGYGTERWWKLTPDVHGSYVNGSWTQAASSHFGRKYFASAVVADGTVIVCGGEYSNTSGSNQNDDTNKSELYHPESNSW